MKMTHRNRVELALAHREPDRVPIDLWGSACRITNPLYFRILEHLGYDDHPERIRPGKTAEYVDYRISDLVDADFRHCVVRSPRRSKARRGEDGIIYDEWGIGYRMIDEYAQIVHHPLAAAGESEVDAYEGPDVEDEGRLQGLAEEARAWSERTDYYITATAPCSGLALDYCCYLRGQEQFLIDMYTNASFAHRLLDRVSDILARLYVYYVTPIAPYIGWVEYESDYGTQQNAWIPREKYRQFIRKPNAKVFEAVKRVAPHTRVFLHSCGAIKDLIPELIENGVDILNSLQPSANGMDSSVLKREFGGELIFHGGVDIQGAICGRREDAVAEAAKRVTAFGPQGGYVFASTNHFQPDTPVENFFAVYETARTLGRYPIGTE